jgi:hypothetical protein
LIWQRFLAISLCRSNIAKVGRGVFTAQPEDQVLIIDLGENEPAARAAAVAIGQGMDEPREGTVVL